MDSKLDLYGLTKKILEKPSNIEATELLYGLNINSVEYYENIISRFVRKKEVILNKSNKTITYDLDADIQDMWDIVFIAQYVYKFWNTEQQNLRKQIDELEKAVPKTENIQKQIDELNKAIEEINDCFEKISKIEELSKVSINVSSNINLSNLDNEISELKRALLIIQKLRDSFEHRNKDLKVSDTIQIDNKKNSFKLSIPAEYIDGFNKGRIIVKDEDRDLIDVTNAVTYPILRELDYDPKKINSFFYNIKPSVISKLLSHTNNDIHELYKLPAELFSKSEYIIDVIYNYFNNQDNNQDIYTLEQLAKLPSFAFYSREQLAKLPSSVDYLIIEYASHVDYKFDLLDYFKKNKLPLSIIPKMFISDLRDPYETIRFIEFLKGKCINFDKVCDSNNKMSILNNKTGYMELFKYFEGNNLDTNIINDFENIDKWEDIINSIEVVRKENINIDINLLFEIFSKRVDAIDIALINKLNTYLVGKYNTNELLPKLYDKSLLFDDPDSIIVLLEDEKSPLKNIELNLILKMNDSGFKHINVLSDLLKNKEELGVSIKDISAFPAVLFKNYAKTKRYIEFMKDEGIKLSNSFKLPLDDYVWNNLENLLKTVKYLKEAFGEKILYELPAHVYHMDDPSKTVFEFFKDNDKDKVKDKAIDKVMEVYKKEKENHKSGFTSAMWTEVFFRYNDSEALRILEAAKENEIPLDTVLKLPFRAAHIETVDVNIEILKNSRELGYDVTEVADEVFESFIAIKKIINYCNSKGIKINFSKIPKKAVHNDLNLDNLEILLKRVSNNFERLDEFPLEFFICDTSLLNELLLNYNINICKSIFGIDNPKIISSLVYANSVLSKLNLSKSSGEYFDFEKLDINPEDIIDNSFEDTIRYTRLNTTNIEDDQYLKQIKTYANRKDTELKEHIIKKFRNSCAHFRYKLIKDDNGKICEDKICLYDEYSNGVNNFNIVIDLKEFVEIIRKVEAVYNHKNENQTTNVNKAIR